MAKAKQREEHDSLGKISLPIDAYYGAQTYRAIMNFPISGRTSHPALIRAYLRIKSAAAVSNYECDVLDLDRFQLIQEGIQKILKISECEWPQLFPIDPYQAGAGTSQNMNINEVIANFANQLAGHPLGTYSPVHPNDHVNRSQSTNDTFPTAMRLSLLEESKFLIHELRKLSQSLHTKANQWMAIPKAGRTHLQDAVPMTLGQEFSAYSLTSLKCTNWIDDARNQLCELGLGGSAVGTGLTVPAGFSKRAISELEKLTGEKLRVAENLCEAMQSQNSVVYYSSMLRLLAIEFTRICNDLRLMSSGPMAGLAELILTPVQPGSSIMPGKVNPSILEMANQAWYSILGLDQTCVYCAQAGQLELNVMMPMMAYSLLEATVISTHTCKVLREKCIDGLQPNLTRLRKYFESTPQIATALSPKLGYEKTAELVQEAMKREISFIDLIKEKHLLSEDEIHSLLNIHLLTGVR